MLLVCLLLLAPADDGPVHLFDGRSLAGWTRVGGKAGNWFVEGDRLATRGDGKDWLGTNRAHGDFVLRLEYQVGPGGNSGVLIRAPRKGDPSFEGIEIQILDDDAPAYRGLKPEQYTGSIYGVVAARRGSTRPAGQWNAMEIRAEGPKISVDLNGARVVDADLSEVDPVPARHAPGVRRTSGLIGLQSHGDPARFRNITIRDLAGPNAAGGSTTPGPGPD